MGDQRESTKVMGVPELEEAFIPINPHTLLYMDRKVIPPCLILCTSQSPRGS